MTATTVPTVGLVIHPTFDSSITNNPNSAAIQATISRAISFHESLFADPIPFKFVSAFPQLLLTGCICQWELSLKLTSCFTDSMEQLHQRAEERMQKPAMTLRQMQVCRARALC
jgi:hypothetical protein